MAEEAAAWEVLLMGRGIARAEAAARLARVSPDPLGTWCLACGVTHPAGLVRTGRCDACRLRGPRPKPWPLVRIGRYHGPLRRLILECKGGAAPELGLELGRLLAAQWRAATGAWPRPGWVVQPVPGQWLRRLERGGDHTAALARGMAEALGVPRARLLRQPWGAPQGGSSGISRRSATADKFRPGRVPAHGPPAGVILVDDVRTTGYTLRRAAEALAGVGVRFVGAAVVAVSHDTPGAAGAASGRGRR